MADLFASTCLGSLSLKNRFVRSATAESLARKDGTIRDRLLPIYQRLAAGGVGLIVSGHMAVREAGKASPGQTGIWSDAHLPGLERMAAAAKANGACAVAQLNHASAPPAELSEDALRCIADAFVDAGQRAAAAGFDGVQVHAAHGYLLSGFLTPAVNARADAHGRDAAGRRRLLLEIVRRLRDTLGPTTTLLCKLGVVDGQSDSLPLAESVETVRALAASGLDGVEISGGPIGSHANAIAEAIDAPEKEAYFAEAAKAVRSAVAIPVILVGGLRSRPVMERVVDAGACDLVALARPLVREPDLVNRFARGETARASCTSCNGCLSTRGLQCRLDA